MRKLSELSMEHSFAKTTEPNQNRSTAANRTAKEEP